MLQNISIPSDKIFGFEIAEKVEIKYKSNEEISASLLFLILQFTFTSGTIHKGRLLKGVSRWVHQKEIYYIRLFSKNRRQG